MNIDQRVLHKALKSLGWCAHRPLFSDEMWRGDVVAKVHPCRTIEVIRVSERIGDGFVGERIEYVHPLYGCGWHMREARVAHALATSPLPARHLGILLHALGGGGRSRRPLGWRRHYYPGGEDVTACEALAASGLMRAGANGYYSVTDEGAAMVAVVMGGGE